MKSREGKIRENREDATEESFSIPAAEMDFDEYETKEDRERSRPKLNQGELRNETERNLEILNKKTEAERLAKEIREKEIEEERKKIYKELTRADVERQLKDISTFHLLLEEKISWLNKDLERETDRWRQREIFAELQDAEKDLRAVESLEKQIAQENGETVVDVKLLNSLTKQSSRLIEWRDELKTKLIKEYKKKDSVSRDETKIDKVKLRFIRKELEAVSKDILTAVQGRDVDMSNGVGIERVKRELALFLVFPVFDREKENISSAASYLLFHNLLEEFKPEDILAGLNSEKLKSFLSRMTKLVITGKVKPVMKETMTSAEYDAFEESGLSLAGILKHDVGIMIDSLFSEALERAKADAENIIKSKEKIREVALAAEKLRKEQNEKAEILAKEAALRQADIEHDLRKAKEEKRHEEFLSDKTIENLRTQDLSKINVEPSKGEGNFKQAWRRIKWALGKIMDWWVNQETKEKDLELVSKITGEETKPKFRRGDFVRIQNGTDKKFIVINDNPEGNSGMILIRAVDRYGRWAGDGKSDVEHVRPEIISLTNKK